MAEQEKKVVIDKKAIKMQKLSEKPLSEYTEAVASAEGKPEAGSAAALVAALAPALGSLAAALAGVDPEGEHKELVAELNEMRKYMLKQVDEMPRSRAPLVKRISEQADGLHLEVLTCGEPPDTLPDLGASWSLRPVQPEDRPLIVGKRSIT